MEYFVLRTSENDSLLESNVNKSSSNSVFSLATTVSNSSSCISYPIDDDNITHSTLSTPSASLVSINSNHSFPEGDHESIAMSLSNTGKTYYSFELSSTAAITIVEKEEENISNHSSSSSSSTSGNNGTANNNTAALRVSFADAVDRIMVPILNEINDSSSTALSHEIVPPSKIKNNSNEYQTNVPVGMNHNNNSSNSSSTLSSIPIVRNSSSSTIDSSKYRRLHCRDVTSFITGSVLGEGMYGVVTQATDPMSNKKVVIKKIKFERDNEGFPVTALREIQALQILRHPNVINLQEVVTSKPSDHNRMLGDVFMVFEYMDGDALGLVQYPELVRTHSQVKCYMKQLLDGLAYLHSNNIIHRDLKPGNLMLNRNHQLKIGDFGLCKRWKVGLPMTGQVVTPWYRAPELFLGDTNAGPPVDVWSVGIIFIEFITGSPPFSNDDTIIQDIWAICGLPTETSWPGVTKLPAWPNARPRKPFTPNIKGKYGRHLSANGIDLLMKLLTLNPTERITAADALNHPYFTEGSGTPEAQSFPIISIERFHCAEVTTIRKNLSRHRNLVPTIARQDDETIVPAVQTTNPQQQQQPAKRRRTNSIAETTNNGSTVRVSSGNDAVTEPSSVTETTNTTTITAPPPPSSSTSVTAFPTAGGLAIPRTIGSVLPRPPTTISNGLLPRPIGIAGGRGLPILARPVTLLARPVSLTSVSSTSSTLTGGLVSSSSSTTGRPTTDANTTATTASTTILSTTHTSNNNNDTTTASTTVSLSTTNSLSPEIDSSSLFLP